MKKPIVLVMILIFGMTGIGWAQIACPLAGGGAWGCQGMSPDRTDIPRGRWWLMPDVVEKHRITGEEQNRLNTLYNENRNTLIDLKGMLEKNLLALELELDKTEFNEKACMAAFQKVQEARTVLAMEGFKYILEVRKILGQERFRQMQSSFKDFRGNSRMKKHPSRKAPGGVAPPSATPQR